MVVLPKEITVKLCPREDGGLRVYSTDVPGLHLSGADPQAVMACILTAARELLRLNAQHNL